MIEVEAVQFSGSAMAEMQCNRRIFTAGMATLVLGMGFPNPARGQQLERSSLKLGVANKAHLYYLPITIAERRGYFRDYGLAIAMSDFEGGGNRSMPCSTALSISQQVRTSTYYGLKPWDTTSAP